MIYILVVCEVRLLTNRKAKLMPYSCYLKKYMKTGMYGSFSGFGLGLEKGDIVEYYNNELLLQISLGRF